MFIVLVDVMYFSLYDYNRKDNLVGRGSGNVKECLNTRLFVGIKKYEIIRILKMSSTSLIYEGQKAKDNDTCEHEEGVIAVRSKMAIP